MYTDHRIHIIYRQLAQPSCTTRWARSRSPNYSYILVLTYIFIYTLIVCCVKTSEVPPVPLYSIWHCNNYYGHTALWFKVTQQTNCRLKIIDPSQLTQVVHLCLNFLGAPPLFKRSLVKRSTVERSIVKRSIVKRSIVKRSIVKRSIVKRSIVKRSTVKRSLVERSIAKRSIVKRSIVGGTLIDEF